MTVNDSNDGDNENRCEQEKIPSSIHATPADDNNNSELCTLIPIEPKVSTIKRAARRLLLRRKGGAVVYYDLVVLRFS